MKEHIKCLVLALIILLLVGCKKEEPIEVSAVNNVEEVSAIEAYGNVVAKETENIAFEFPTKVIDINALNGQYVKTGDILFKVDLVDYKNLVEEKERALAIKEIELNNLLNEQDENVSKAEISINIQIEAEQEELSRLESKYFEMKNDFNNKTLEDLILATNNISQKESAMMMSEEDYLDGTELYNQGIISENEYKLLQTAQEQAKQAYDEAVLDYEQLEKDIEEEIQSIYYNILVLRSKIQGLEIEKVNSNVDYELLLLELASLEEEVNEMSHHINQPYIMDNGDIISHVDGIFDGFTLEKGDYIAGKGEKTYSMINNEKLEVKVEISEDFIKDVKIDAPVAIIPVASRNKTYHGKVSFISDMAYNNGGESVLLVYVTIEDNDGFLKPNFSVDIEIER